MKKNKGFALMGVLFILSFVMISLSGMTMLQMSEIKLRRKMTESLKIKIEKFNNEVKEAGNGKSK